MEGENHPDLRPPLLGKEGSLKQRFRLLKQPLFYQETIIAPLLDKEGVGGGLIDYIISMVLQKTVIITNDGKQ